MTQLNFNSVFVPWNYEKIMKKKKLCIVRVFTFMQNTIALFSLVYNKFSFYLIKKSNK